MQTYHGSLTLSPTEIESLTTCVELIGTSEFPARFCHFCLDLCNVDAVFLSAFFKENLPATLYTNHNDKETLEKLETYTNFAYVLDPFYLRFKQGSEVEVLDLNDCAPHGFTDSEYYKEFYAAIGLVSECGLLVPINNQAGLLFSFGTSDTRCESQFMRLLSAKSILAALVYRHWPTLRPDRTDGFGQRAAFVEQAFQKFSSSVLSPREAEIARLIMKGYSTKMIARVFGNSPETIKVHRKRLYTKLQIESQGELLGLFIESLSCTPATSTGDPLKHYGRFASQA